MPRNKEIFDGKHRDSPLAVNLRLLVKRQAEDSVNAWVAKFDGKLSQSTINRVCNGKADASISLLLQIADATGYAPWQLVHPEFDPRTMPPLADPRAMRAAAVYASIKVEADAARALAILEQFAPADEAVAAAKPKTKPARSR